MFVEYCSGQKVLLFIATVSTGSPGPKILPPYARLGRLTFDAGAEASVDDGLSTAAFLQVCDVFCSLV